MIELVIKAELDEITQEVIDVGLSEVALSRTETLSLISRFYGTVLTAVQYMVITPEEAQFMHVWLTSLLEL